MFAWTTRTHAGPNIPPNPLPAGTFVRWGLKTKEGFGPGVLRYAMEVAGGVRAPDAQHGGNMYTNLAGGTSAVSIYLAKDKVLLRGQFYAANPNVVGAGTGLCALLLSGSGGSIGRYMASAIDEYQRWGAAVLAVDYRGYGQSDGTSTAHGLYTDAEAMLNCLIAPLTSNGFNIQADRIVVHGYSLGSGPATELAVRYSAGHRIAGLVLHCPFASFGRAASWQMPRGTKRVVGKIASWGIGYDNIGKVLHTDVPLHVVFATGDENVNPKDGADIAAVNRGGAATTKQEYDGDHYNVDRVFTSNHDRPHPHTTGTLRQFVTGLPRN